MKLVYFPPQSLFVTMDGGLRRSWWSEAGCGKPSTTSFLRLATGFSGNTCFSGYRRSASSRKPVLRPRHFVSCWVLSQSTPGQTRLLVRPGPHGGFYGSFSKTVNRDPNQIGDQTREKARRARGPVNEIQPPSQRSPRDKGEAGLGRIRTSRAASG